MIQYFTAVTNKNIDDVRFWKIPRWSNLDVKIVDVRTYMGLEEAKRKEVDHNHESKWMELIVYSSTIHSSK